MKTLVITNFAGRLTRQNYGDINSGFAKFDTSWGYNPFVSPGSLSWFKAPTDVSAIISDNSLVLAGQSRIESGTLYTYAISDSGKIWKIGFDGGSASNIATLSSGTPTFNYGGSLYIYNGKLWIGHDKGVTRLNLDGTGETQVGTWASNYVQNTYRPLVPFAGKLYVGNTTNGTNTNIGEIDTTNTLSTVSKLSPALGFNGDVYVRDMDVTTDLTYLVMSVSNINAENMTPVNDFTNTASGDSSKLYWNGTDLGVTTGTSLPGFGITALNSFGSTEFSMMYDTLGAALYEGSRKKWTLRNMKSPFPNAVTSTGNFLTWTTPEMYWNLDTSSATMRGSLYYYGSLDDEVGVGLWRLNTFTDQSGGQIYQVPFNHFTTNRYVSISGAGVVQVDSNGAHLYSRSSYNGSTTTKKLYVFLASPPDNSPGEWTGATHGVYETQTQLFSDKQVVKQIRVYTSPTVSSNSFQIDVIGSSGKVVSVTNPMTYTYASGTDTTQLQGSLTRINFNPNMAPDYGIGIRVTNAGDSDMTIAKIEVDYDMAGK